MPVNVLRDFIVRITIRVKLLKNSWVPKSLRYHVTVCLMLFK